LELDTQYFAVYNIRGHVYEERGEFDKALADYTKCIELSPNAASGYYFRANLWEKMGDLENATADKAKSRELAQPVKVPN
jgi:tetratricopeptide (TPR) repeat protein